VRNIAEVTIAVANGDLSRKITVDVRGEILQLKEAINTMVDQLRSFASEVTRVARDVGYRRQARRPGDVPGVAGTWKDLTDYVNAMATNLTSQVRNIAEVTTAVARATCRARSRSTSKGEILELKNTINTMVDSSTASRREVTRVAREVGTEGKLGGQADVPGVAARWKDLTDNVNFDGRNLTPRCATSSEVDQRSPTATCRARSRSTSAARSCSSKETLNTMVRQLRLFAGR
jgi:HAMP domain-containing protein